MQLKEIIAEHDSIVLLLDEEYNGIMTFREEAPLIHGDCVTVDASELHFDSGKACLTRRIGEHDRAFDRFRPAVRKEGFRKARRLHQRRTAAFRTASEKPHAVESPSSDTKSKTTRKGWF